LNGETFSSFSKKKIIILFLFFEIGIPGAVNDTNSSRRCDSIINAVGTNFALSDPGYEGVEFCVSGIGKTRIHTKAQRAFDKLSRYEQKPIEHVNSFIKKCAIISSERKFHHHRIAALAGAVFVCCGLYNYKKQKGWAYKPLQSLLQK